MPDFKSIFHSALDIRDEVERRQYLDAACGRNAELRAQVDSLIHAHAEAQEFMRPANEEAEPAIGITVGGTIGSYKLREKIGEGGMGVVFVAEQTEPVRRKVALKIIKPGMDTREVIARFQAERQALAMMDHPNIAKVFDGGATENGRPYFVMELVRGVAVTEFCDQACLDTVARLKLFVTISQAIQHAHRRGVIHRDIKPSNVLVSLHDDIPVPKVIDFGVAKAVNRQFTEVSVYTRFHQVIGTPLYMSPEQAELSGLDIDTRTDVYSLGVLLYELLTGVTPFDREHFSRAAYDEMRRIIREDEPQKPSARISSLSHAEQSQIATQRGSSPARLTQQLRGELDWIVTKALEKNRRRRYDSASDIADDVGRYLRKEPVSAAAPSAMYKLRKFVIRQKVLAATSATVLLSLLLGVAGTTWQAIRAQNNETQAIRNLYISEIATAKREYDAFNTRRAGELVDKYLSPPSHDDFRGFEWRWLWKQFHGEEFQLAGHTGDVRVVRFSRDGKLLASGATDGFIRLWDLNTKQQLWSYKGGEHCNLADISPDRTRLVAKFYAPVADCANLWDISILNSIVAAEGPSGGRVSADGQRMFSWGGGQSERPAILDSDGNILEEFEFGRARHVTEDFTTAITDDEIWDLPSGKMLAKLPPHTGIITPDWSGAAVSPVDPNRIVTGAVEGARVWDRCGNLLATLPNTTGTPITVVDFSRNGDLLAVYKVTGGVQIYDSSSSAPEEWNQVRVIPVRAGAALAFSPVDNERLVVGDETGLISGYRVAGGATNDIALNHENTVVDLRFSPDGRYLVVGMQAGECHLWDTRNQTKLLEVPAYEDWQKLSDEFFCRDTFSFSPDSQRIAIIGPRDTLTICDITTGGKVICPTSIPSEGADEGADVGISYCAPEFSPDGKRLYAGSARGSGAGCLETLDLTAATPRVLEQLTQFFDTPVRSLDISHDGGLLAVAKAGMGGECASIYRLPDMRLIKTLELGVASTQEVRFSPDGKVLASSSFNPQAVTLWDTSSWLPTATLHHAYPVTHISWSEDSKRLAASDFSAKTQLWDVETGQVVATFDGAASDFSRDGMVLAVGSMGSKYVFDDTGLGHVIVHRAPSAKDIPLSQ